MANQSFTLTVTKPAPFNVGLQTISGRINAITIVNPGPQQTNTAYNGQAQFSYQPGSIGSLTFNNAVPASFVAVTTAHGGATLGTKVVNIGLYNFVAQQKPFQVQDNAAPGLAAGDILQSAIASYPVTDAAPTHQTPTPIQPTLPSKIWLCWRTSPSTINVTDGDVFPATLNLSDMSFSAQVNVDHPGVASTLYISSNGTTWTPVAGSPWTPGTGVVTAMTVATPGQQATLASFTVSGTLSGYSTAPTLNYRDDSGAYVALPSGASVTTTGYSFTHPPMAAGAHTISVRDAGNTAVGATTASFSVVVAASLTIATPGTQPAGGSFAVSGTLIGYTAPPTLSYRDDAGTYAALPAGASVTATSYVFTHPGMTAGTHTVSVRDSNNTATAVTSAAFNVTAPTVPVITVTAPSLPATQQPFTLSGTLSGYSAAPTLTYADDGATATVLPAGSLVSATAYRFIHPGRAAGAHTTVISDGTQTGSTNYTITDIVGGASPNRSTITGTAGSLTDTLSNRYTITADKFVAINGLVDTIPASTIVGLGAGANATYTLVGSTYTYTIILLVVGTLPVGTFWFAWLPAQSYLPSIPTPLPTFGWTALMVGPEAGGYSIQWVANTPAAPGTSVSFSFTSPDPPSVVFGPSFNFPSTNTATSFVYGGQPFSDAGASLVVTNNPATVPVPTTSNAIAMAYVDGLIYYENGSGLWFSQATPSGPWAPPGGTLISPLATVPSLALNAAPSNIRPNAPFTITGSLANYTAIPTLSIVDDGSPAMALPAGSSVTLTGFSIPHGGMPAGTHTLLVSDGVRSNSIVYNVVSATFTALPATTSLTTQVTGLQPGTSYDVEVYATNQVGQGPPSAIITVTTLALTIALPGAPTGLTAAGVTQTAVNLVWVAPTTGAPAVNYGTRWSPTGANTWTNGPVVTVTTAQITGLASGTTYDFQVWGINGSGAGAFSATMTAATAASTLAATTWQPQGASASLSFSNGNLTATSSGSTTTGAARQACVSNNSISTGKASFEVTLTGISNSCSLGLANATFPFSLQLGEDANSLGYFPANVPATVATGSVAGLPLWGMSCQLCYPEGGGFSGNHTAADNIFLAHQQYFATPRTMECFPGDWNAGNGSHYLALKAAAWGIDQYFKNVTPIMGIVLTTIDHVVTFDTLAAGQNDGYFRPILTAWKNAGFRRVGIRLCWEDNYPTTPSGQGAQAGSSYISGAYTPWSQMSHSAYAAGFAKAWRNASFVLKGIAAQIGLDITVMWGPTVISSCFIDPRLCYPDNDMSDGRGKSVDCHAPDIYFGNYYGNVHDMRSGYENAPAFTNFAVTGQAATTAIFGADRGSAYWWADYTGGRYIAPPATPSTPLAWSGGWGMYESMVFCLQHGCSMFWPEYGGLSVWDGASYTRTGAKQNGTNVTSGGTGAANMTEMAAWARSRIAWFQDKNKNGIANGVFLGFSWWQNQSVETLQAHAAVFPEFRTDPDAGTRSSGGLTTTTPGIVPQTVRSHGVALLVPSGNLPAADAAGATFSFCVDADADRFWVTSPAMRAAYGATAWNDSATANPATGVGGIPFSIAGSLSICFDTGEAGGVAVLNAGASAYSIAMPSNFPPWQGAAPTVVVPGQVTGLAVVSAQSITVPASIPSQKSGQAFTAQAAFNYTPNPATLYYNPYNGAAAGNINIGGQTMTPFSVAPSSGGSITFDPTGQIATLRLILNSVGAHVFQIADVQPGGTILSQQITFQIVSGTAGGGDYTATAAAPATSVSLRWTAPTTGSGPFTYIVEQSPAGLGTYSIVGSTNTTSIAIPGLNPGVPYDYVVYAANGAGNGTISSSVPYTVPGSATQLAPLAAGGLVASSPTPSSISLAWQKAQTGPPPTGYQVQYKPVSGSTYLNFSPTTVQQQQVITGLAGNTTYNFRVVAFNAVGNAPASSPAITATTLPVPTSPTTSPLLTMLNTLSGQASISGEYVGVGPVTPITTIAQQTGLTLGLLGGDYWTPGTAGNAVLTFNPIAIDHWTQGGLVMLSPSMPNPTTHGPATDVSDLDVAGLLTAGTTTNAAFRTTLDQIAAGLAQLQAAGVTVIFRPFARANDPSLWWGAGNHTKTT
jgi:hypothetical protein